MMMKKLGRKDSASYKVDMASITEDESFPCPKCGMIISPDDNSEKAYKILEPKVDDNNELIELTIICGRCGSTIKLS